MNRNRNNLAAIMALLAPMKKANGGHATDVVTADSKVVRFLSGAGGKFDLPLVVVGYAGAPKQESLSTRRLLHGGWRLFDVFLITRDMAGVESELTAPGAGLLDLIEAVEDRLAGAFPFLVNAAGDFVTAEGAVTTTPHIDGVKLGHPIECIGDAPEPMPPEAFARNLVGWSVSVRFRQDWLPDRGDVVNPADMDGYHIDLVEAGEPRMEIEGNFPE